MRKKFEKFFAIAIVSFSVFSFSSTNKMVFAQDSDWTTFGSDMYSHTNVTGNIGIGVSNPGKKCDMKGPCRIRTDNDAKLFLKDTTSNESWSLRTLNDHEFQIYNEEVGGGARLHIEPDGDVGIGNTSPTAKFHISETHTANSDYSASQLDLTLNLSSDPGSGTNIVGHDINMNFPVPYTTDLPNVSLSGLDVSVNHFEDSDIKRLVGGNIGVWKAGSGSVTSFMTGTLSSALLYAYDGETSSAGTVYGAFNQAQLYSTGTGSVTATTVYSNFNYLAIGAGSVTNAYGVYVNFNGSSTNTTNGYGLYLTDVEAVNSWGVYQEGTDDTNYLAGDVGIGTTTPQGKLDVNGAIYQRGSQLHADYVFESDYDLESIREHADFMWKNKHLKSVPKQKTDENGLEIIEVGSHRKGMLEELEKAHIYIEQLDKQNNVLKEKIANLETLRDENRDLEARLTKIEMLINARQ